MAKNKGLKTSNTINFGNIQGPVHVGSGDIHIDQINYSTTNENKATLQEEILQRIDNIAVNSAETMGIIIDQLNNQQLAEINHAYNLLENHQLLEKDIMQILSELQTVIEKIDDKAIPSDLVTNVKATANIIDVEEMSANHKLKLSVPLIPLLLNYETEIGIDSTINLKKAWDWVKEKIQSQ